MKLSRRRCIIHKRKYFTHWLNFHDALYGATDGTEKEPEVILQGPLPCHPVTDPSTGSSQLMISCLVIAWNYDGSPKRYLWPRFKIIAAASQGHMITSWALRNSPQLQPFVVCPSNTTIIYDVFWWKLFSRFPLAVIRIFDRKKWQKIKRGRFGEK